MAHEPVHHITPGVRLVWLVGEYGDVRHQRVPDRAGYLVPEELRLAPLLIVWRAQCLALSVHHKPHSQLKSHVHELDGCPRRRQRVDGVREVRAIAEEVLMVESVLAHEMPKALSVEPLLRFHSIDIVKKSLEVGDEWEVSLRVEQGGSPVVVLVRDVQGEARFGLIIVETEDRNICLKCVFEGRDLVGF